MDIGRRLAQERDPSRPLSLDELEYLYSAAHWHVLLENRLLSTAYTKFQPLSVVKAHCLPYLVHISSERALKRELSERQPFAALCGFLHGNVPTRANLWHFRATPPGLYRELIVQALAMLVLSGESPFLKLPYVSANTGFSLTSNGEEVTLPPTPFWRGVRVLRMGNAVATEGRAVQTYLFKPREGTKSSTEIGLAANLGLPCYVTRKRDSVEFLIRHPWWVDYKRREGGLYRTTGLGSGALQSYVSCLLLVTRRKAGVDELLLWKVLDGYAKGLYSLPGGKINVDLDESIEQCAIREAKEELGITVEESHPVSLRYNKLRHRPPVVNVGVHVERFCGKPRVVESNKYGNIEWFNQSDVLSRLGSKLFLPARFAIMHYITQTFAGLKWEQIDQRESSDVIDPRQMPLFQDES